MSENNLYPIFLKLDSIQTLIVGGGCVGLEKVQFILKQSPNAKIKIVAKEFHSELILLAIKNVNIQIAERGFVEEDLIETKLLIVATNNELLNKEIHQKAKMRDIIINVVDNPMLCDFYTGAVMKKGSIKVAVSSNGASPTLAKRLRDVFQEIVPEEIDEAANMLQEARTRLKGDLTAKIKTLNAITAILSNDYRHSSKLKDNSVLHNINLN